MKKKRLSLLLCQFLLFGFLLGVRNGRIALWKYDNPTPIKVFPYSVSALPKQARQELEKGIPIDSMEDLERLLEKYLP